MSENCHKGNMARGAETADPDEKLHYPDISPLGKSVVRNMIEMQDDLNRFAGELLNTAAIGGTGIMNVHASHDGGVHWQTVDPMDFYKAPEDE